MCRSPPDYHGSGAGGLYQKTHLLKIKAFYLYLYLSLSLYDDYPSPSSASNSNSDLPDLVTLLFLPRRINDSPLEVNGSMIRPDSAAFLTLHRLLLNAPPCGDVVVFSTREPVRTSHGSRFEVLLGQHSLLKGAFGSCVSASAFWSLSSFCQEVKPGKIIHMNN